MQLADTLQKKGQRLSLAWLPRDDNELADAISKQDFEAFDEDEEDQVPMGIMGERPLSHKMLKSGCEDTHDSATGETWFGPH